VALRDSGALTDAELTALKSRLIHGWTQALTREARSSVPRRCVPFSPSGPPEGVEELPKRIVLRNVGHLL